MTRRCNLGIFHRYRLNNAGRYRPSYMVALSVVVLVACCPQSSMTQRVGVLGTPARGLDLVEDHTSATMESIKTDMVSG